MTSTITADTFDESRPGCPDMLDGQHRIEWLDVPAQTWAFDKHRDVPARRRGVCLACGETFTGGR